MRRDAALLHARGKPSTHRQKATAGGGSRIRDKKISPKGENDIKLISAGKILENSKTVGQCRAPFGELPRGIITMHVVVQPSVAKAKTEKKIDEAPRKNICSFSIL
ncbi:hypothetical protein ACLB2K_006387 [Fragaria x ananassa]